ncbi:7721_t:CDS:2 [Paraglomus brasilianum]|uniref:7721_t:CDS:1 n=1 Tax=Paraglomus brasilianum TaxID=144538 RepID=A0A9N9A9K7_9GLOM|nr:7721_t:CDS:2 [Paraglomus brasilianum]
MLGFWRRSYEVLKTESVKAVKGTALTWQKELPMLQLNTKEDLQKWVVGSDKDIGGNSDAKLEITPENVCRFYGNVCKDLPPIASEQAASGYAGMRSKVRGLTVFGTPNWDTSMFRFLALRVRGDNKKYFVNMQTEGVHPADLWQHRLFLRNPGQWEVVMIPFRDFILTRKGIILEPQIEMNREKVKTVGFSLLAQSGPFSLEIDYITAINTEETEGDWPRITKPKKDKEKAQIEAAL